MAALVHPFSSTDPTRTRQDCGAATARPCSRTWRVRSSGSETNVGVGVGGGRRPMVPCHSPASVCGSRSMAMCGVRHRGRLMAEAPSSTAIRDGRSRQLPLAAQAIRQSNRQCTADSQPALGKCYFQRVGMPRVGPVDPVVLSHPIRVPSRHAGCWHGPRSASQTSIRKVANTHARPRVGGIQSAERNRRSAPCRSRKPSDGLAM